MANPVCHTSIPLMIVNLKYQWTNLTDINFTVNPVEYGEVNYLDRWGCEYNPKNIANWSYVHI